MPEDLVNSTFSITSEDRALNGKRRADQLIEVRGNEIRYPPPPVLQPQTSMTLPRIPHPIPIPFRFPRDRSNSVDTHFYRTVYPHGEESSSRGISSTSSSSPMNALMQPCTPPYSPMNIRPQALPTSSNSILMKILVNNDGSSTRDTNSKYLEYVKSANKKSKSEDSIDRRIMPPPTMSSRRYSFGGEAYRSYAQRRIELTTQQNKTERASTMPSGSSRLPDSPILYSLISSLSTNSPPESFRSQDSVSEVPLDLTPRNIQVEYVHLAKKVAQTVQAKVTTYIRWSAEYVFTYRIPSMNWYFVFKSVWHRLLIVCMAEHGLDIVYVVSKQVFETLSTGEPVLPWIGISRDATDIIPTRTFAEKVIDCIESLRRLRMTTEDYRDLRDIILFTSNHRSSLTERVVKTLHERWMNTRPQFGSDSREIATLRGSIQKLEELKASPIAGLLCSHLRGEGSKDLILSQKMRNSIRDIDGSILGSLICDPPDLREAPFLMNYLKVLEQKRGLLPPR